MDSFPLIVLITAVVVASAFSVVSVLMLVRSRRRLGRRPMAGFGPPPARRKRSRWTLAAYGLAVILAAPAAYYAVVVLGAHTDHPRARRERGFALPFTGLQSPRGVAVDAKGNVYVADNTDSRVFELMAGSNTQTVLPFTGLHEPTAVAVDAAGNVYVSDVVDSRVLKLAAGSHSWTRLPSAGVEEHVAADAAGWRWTPAETCTSPASSARAVWC